MIAARPGRRIAFFFYGLTGSQANNLKLVEPWDNTRKRRLVRMSRKPIKNWKPQALGRASREGGVSRGKRWRDEITLTSLMSGRCHPSAIWHITSASHPDTPEIREDKSSVIRVSIFCVIMKSGIAQWVEHRTEKPGRHNTDAGSIPLCGNGFFSPKSQLSVQTLLRCLYSPSVRSQALSSVSTQQMLNTDDHTYRCLDTHITVHTGRNGWCSSCSCGCCLI